ncbi:ATP-binding protein [Streptomyces sp. NPDC096339]|uniref:ATP-binding protein n=1 Tax=Streptomyces sp. NPDC096339 TaxID=3366086 RepID=UPI0037F2C478
MHVTTGSCAIPAPQTVRSFVHWVADPVAAHVPQVRARVRAILESWRVPVHAAEALLLAVSELVGNVVRHSGTGRMRIGLSCGGGWFRLEVADQGATLPRLPSPRLELDPESEDGRGLLLVQLLTAELGGGLTVTADASGKSVRVRIPAF